MFPVPKRRTSELQKERGPVGGRLILLLAAYAPVVAIAGLRGAPCIAGWIAFGLGVAGIIVWAAFLPWLKNRQPRPVEASDIEFIDTEVTGYIVSLLLPVAAASNPSFGDWLAYGVCALLILLVAFQAELWSVNPVTYAFRMRAARMKIDGETRIVLVAPEFDVGQLAASPNGDPPTVIVSRRLGVTMLLEVASSPEELG
jgi:hypothetical protein